MNTRIILQSCVLLITLSFNPKTLLAQEIKNCGEVKTDTAFLLSVVSREKDQGYRIETTSRMVNIFIHILHHSDGNNAAVSLQQVNEEFGRLVQDFSSNNMCFFLAGVDHIYSTDLNINFDADADDPNEFDPYQVPNCLNIFYVQRIQGQNTACDPPCGYGGIALGGIPGTFCLVDDGNVGSHTISHEIGHCLGLSHTFARINGRECIDGSNSSTAGDLIGDTNADPYSFNSSSCYSMFTDGCNEIYSGDCEDPCGSTFYHPPYSNLMSYWGSCSPQSFSTLQFTRINVIADTYSPVSACTSPASYTQNAINVSSGYLIKAAINSFSTNGNVNITSSAVASFGGSSVSLMPGFNAAPSGNGSTTVKITGCN